MRCLIPPTLLLILLAIVSLAAFASPPPDSDASPVSGDVVEEALARFPDDACSQGGGEEGACALAMLQHRAGRSTGAAAEGALGEEAEGELAEAGPALLEATLARKEGQGGGPGGYGGYGGYSGYYAQRGAGGPPVDKLMTLYHQTSAEAGHSILKTGFRRGTWHAICGSAIYFSPSISDTDHKAMGGRGFIIEAVVNVGRVLHMPRDCDPSMTPERMHMMGYDSITLDRGGYVECKGMAHCVEWIIYDKSRVVSMKGYEYHGWKHWYSKSLAEANATATSVDGAAADAAAAAA